MPSPAGPMAAGLDCMPQDLDPFWLSCGSIKPFLLEKILAHEGF